MSDNHNPYQASITQLLEFLLELKNKGIGYSSINTAKSCISSIYEIVNTEHVNVSVGKHVLLIRFIRGILIKDNLCQNIVVRGMYLLC